MIQKYKKKFPPMRKLSKKDARYIACFIDADSFANEHAKTKEEFEFIKLQCKRIKEDLLAYMDDARATQTDGLLEEIRQDFKKYTARKQAILALENGIRTKVKGWNRKVVEITRIDKKSVILHNHRAKPHSLPCDSEFSNRELLYNLGFGMI